MLKRKKLVAFIMTMALSMTMLCGCLEKGPDPNAEKIAHLFNITEESLFYATNLSVSGTGKCDIYCSLVTPLTSSNNKGVDLYSATENIDISFTRQYAGTKDYQNTLVINGAYDQKDTSVISVTSTILGGKIYDKSERYGYTLVQNVNNGITNSSGTSGNNWSPIPDIDLMNLLLPDLDQCSLYIDLTKSSKDKVVLTQDSVSGFDYYRPFVNALSQKINSNHIDDVSYTFDANTNLLISIDISGRYAESENALNDCKYYRSYDYHISIAVDSYEF